MTEIYDLDILTTTTSYYWTILNEVDILRTALETTSITDDSDLSRLVTKIRHQPEGIQRVILTFSAPFPELITLFKTSRLLSEIYNRWPPYHATRSANLDNVVYISRTMVAGNHYYSRIANCSSTRMEQYQQLDLNPGQVLIRRNDVGLREVSLFNLEGYGDVDQGPYYSSLDLSLLHRKKPLLIGEMNVCANLHEFGLLVC